MHFQQVYGHVLDSLHYVFPEKKVFPDPPGKTWCKHVIRVPPRAVDNPIGNPTKFGIEFRNPIAGLNSDSHSHNYGSSSAKGEELVFA